MTEDEMKKTWCPHARVLVYVEIGNREVMVSGNRISLTDRVELFTGEERSNPTSARCLGSACSQWRWETTMETDTDDRGYVSGHYKSTSSEHGYCGLAGKP